MKKLIFSLALLFSTLATAGNDGGGAINSEQLALLLFQNQLISANPVYGEDLSQSVLNSQYQVPLSIVPVQKFKFVGGTEYSKVFSVNDTEQTFEVLDSVITQSPTLPVYVNEAIQSGDWISVN